MKEVIKIFRGSLTVSGAHCITVKTSPLLQHDPAKTKTGPHKGGVEAEEDDDKETAQAW
jgi:hypothetical protein